MHHRVPRPKTWHVWYRNPPLLVTPGNVPRLSSVEKVEGPAGKTGLGNDRQFKGFTAFFKVFGGFVGDFSRGFRLLEPSIASRCDNAPIRCRTCAGREAFIDHARARRPPPDRSSQRHKSKCKEPMCAERECASVCAIFKAFSPIVFCDGT